MTGNGLRFVFIGCGKIAHFHADVVYAHGHKIVGVAARKNSKNIHAFADKYQITARYSDFNLLLDEQKPDAVIVCVSWDQTQKIIKEIIQYGYPVLVEKPIALTLDEVSDIYHQTTNNTNNVMVGYNRRFYDFIPEIKQAVTDLNLLSVQLVLPESVGGLIKSKSGSIKNNMLTYMSSHWLDLLIYLLGDIEASYMHNNSSIALKNETYHGILTSKKNGVPIHYISDYDTFQNISISFVFDDSVWKLSPIEVLSIYDKMDRVDPTEKMPIRQYKPRLKKQVRTNLDYKPGFYKQMDCFIKCFVTGKEHNSVGATLKQTVMTTKLTEAIQQK